jgi:hypothetical protein
VIRMNVRDHGGCAAALEPFDKGPCCFGAEALALKVNADDPGHLCRPPSLVVGRVACTVPTGWASERRDAIQLSHTSFASDEPAASRR